MSGRAMSSSRGVIGVNVVLLGVLGVVTLAGAQPSRQNDGTQRGRGEYTAVSGRIQGSTANGVYVLDTTNQELLALRWNRNDKRVEVFGFRDLKQDSARQQSGR
ncbi:MAG TPA: hypothetical protein VD963_03530 [Phycisphaerales bacterium]|nr:hypothetical protein [Phycisphaerales bacterium]